MRQGDGDAAAGPGRSDAAAEAAGREAAREKDDYVAIVFDSEPQAVDGLHALWDLDRRGELTVHGATVIRRHDRGRIDVAMQQHTDRGLRTAAGVGIGALIGAFAGPIAAATIGIGATYGGIVGLAADALESRERDEAVHEAGSSLKDGQCGVIAEVTEDWTRPLDAPMRPLGGTVYRRPTSSVRGDMVLSFNYPDALVPYDYQPHFEKETSS